MHCCVDGSQTRAEIGQSAAVLQPMHAPVVAQIGAVPRWQVAVVALHAAWHV
jgi:hypothetical protein